MAMKNYADGIHEASQIAAALAVEAIGKLSDQTICPQVWIIVPHGPGVITKGSKTVFINDLPASREEDVLHEAIGGPDPVARGFQSVIIGDEGSHTELPQRERAPRELLTAPDPIGPESYPAETIDPENVSVERDSSGSFWDLIKNSALDLFDKAVFLLELQLNFTVGLIVGFAMAFAIGVSLLALAELSVFAAILVGIALAAWAIYGVYQLVRAWPSMTPQQKAFAFGQIVGAIAGGYYSNSFYTRNVQPRLRSAFPRLNAWRLRELAWIRSFRAWLESKLPAQSVAYGKNAARKLRQHSQHIRETARKLGIEIPKGPAKPATRAAMQSFIAKVVTEGARKTGQYMTIEGAQWSKLGDAMVIRKPNGEFLTFLDYSKGGVAKGWDVL